MKVFLNYCDFQDIEEILNGEELNIILDEGRDKTRELAKERFELMKKRMGVGR